MKLFLHTSVQGFDRMCACPVSVCVRVRSGCSGSKLRPRVNSTLTSYCSFPTFHTSLRCNRTRHTGALEHMQTLRHLHENKRFWSTQICTENAPIMATLVSECESGGYKQAAVPFMWWSANIQQDIISQE